MKLRTILAATTAAVAVGVALLLPAAAEAGGRVVPGGACNTVGAAGWRGDDQYRCVQKPGDECPKWHWVYRRGTPHTWTPRPAGSCPCASPSSVRPSSSPSSTPSTVPSPSVSVTAAGTPATTSADTPAGGELPVTGGPLVPLLATGGLVLIGFGVGLRRIVRRRSN